MTRRPASGLLAYLAALVCLGLVLAGCGSGGTTAPTTTNAPAGGGEPAANTIVVSNFAFSPATLTVSAGATVTVRNDDSTAHTVTADGAKVFDTGDVDPGATSTFKAPAKPGSYPYICTLHPFMEGTLKVS